jgi:hypothetical protein
MGWVEWVFSGIGVSTILIIGGLFFKKKQHESQQSIHAGDNSNNIQGGKDVKVTFGEKKDD